MMALRSELAEQLSGFEKRMKFIHIVRFLTEYTYPDKMKKMIPDRNVLDNLIIAVLVYIKDRTLGTEQTCTLEDVARFLDDFSVVLPDYKVNAAELAQYIVVDVLQNGGKLQQFLTFNSRSESFEWVTIRLINEEKNTYYLTDDAFDFLFRSKEIESELDYSVTRFRMKEYMKRDNYEQALDASRELVSRILNMRTGINDFLRRCQEDISGITVDQYEDIVKRIRSLLEEEHTELTDIQHAAKDRAQKLEDAFQSGLNSNELTKRYNALAEIIRNISRTIDEQRALINERSALSKSYQKMIRNNFVIHRYERLDFEQEIMVPLRKMGDALGDAAKFLLFPLIKPELEPMFSIENFYAPQGKIREADEAQGLDLTETEDPGNDLTEVRNNRHRAIVRDFFAFAHDKAQFTVSEFMDTLTVAQIKAYSEENALPNVILSMYAMQELDLEGWKATERFTTTPHGEFELSWCLEGLPEAYVQPKRICFSAADPNVPELAFVVRTEAFERTVTMTNFHVEVYR